ncbi:hypothetical protein [Methanoculleus chikugoensis]|uniref:hypothetical protein n=1 Tax=Methanoculleus chikugoensis TaxID=118126 RepID=UPI000A908178|nr:hypothetical protein [Methanoculleus chikugoensis]
MQNRISSGLALHREAGLRDPSPRSAGQTAIIPPAVVAGLVLVLRSMSLIASGLLVAGQIVGPIAGALVAVVLMKIEPGLPPRTKPPHDDTGSGRSQRPLSSSPCPSGSRRSCDITTVFARRRSRGRMFPKTTIPI